LRFQFFATALADIEKLARIERHLLDGPKAAFWAGESRFQLHGCFTIQLIRATI